MRDSLRAEVLADEAARSTNSMTHIHHTWHSCAATYALIGKSDKAIQELEPARTLDRASCGSKSPSGRVGVNNLLTCRAKDWELDQEYAFRCRRIRDAGLNFKTISWIASPFLLKWVEHGV